MSRPLKRCVLTLIPVLALLAGCDVPNVPLAGGDGTGPVLRGQVKQAASTDLRVGLLGSVRAGQPSRELVGAPVGDGGSYTLNLPASPPFDLMTSDNESATFTLSAYQDKNQNGRYDASDEVTEASAASGTFRFFVEDGPAGSYKSGWNLYKDGQYVQSFDTAFVLQ